ncbi:MAG TPA: hypothetical protein VLF66_05050 [Thermoanaerobaculia bacterium]|nr:hypothetical protein [Thermoanaerobaculia bacterium]
MAKRDCEALLQELQRNKRNRTVKEVERVGDKVLKLPYVVHVIRKIEEAREIAQGRDEEPD